jgi:natural product biosynthesis luciferase-like monooxygenase protein/amino acid adenylation domain-containing protein/FkbM family methyltransferase
MSSSGNDMDQISSRLARLDPEQLADLVQRLRASGSGAPADAIPRRDPGEPRPLSFAQQRLWFVQQLDPASVAYNMVSATRLEGRLDAGALQRALDTVVARHDALRTVIATRGGEPVQEVSEAMRIALETDDLSSVPAARRDEETERRARAEQDRPFDLAAGPLLRARLLRFGDERHVLLLAMHHVISDGWSRGVMVREVSQAYTALVRGDEPRLPGLPIQYPDFAAWQRERMQGERLAKELGYWTGKLAGAPPALALPTDRNRPAVQSFAGASHRFRLPEGVEDALRSLAREEGATLFMVLLAAYKTLLARYTGQADLVVGTPVANRGRSETEGLVGFFANMLALRTDLSGDPTFREALRRVRDTALGGYAHEELPFERLVEELHPERSLSRNLVFQTVFLLDESPARPFRLPGLDLVPVEIDPGTSMFDLTFGIEKGDEGLIGRMEYATALFDAATVERMADGFGELLRGIAARPDARVSELPVMPQAEHALIARFNDTDAGYPAGLRVHDLFAAQAARTPDAAALVFRGAATSYAELDARANRLANHLRSLGAGPETRVGVCLERTPELVVALLAVLKAGGAYVPLDPAYPRERLGYMTQDAGVRFVLTSAALADRLPADAEPVCIDAVAEAIASQSAGAPESGAGPENLSHVIFTSGSTGRPKGVMIRHSSTVVLLHWLRENVTDEERASVLFSTSINFDVSVAEIFGTLCWGGKLVLVENALELPAVADQEIRYASMVPTAAAELLRSGGIPASVRTLNLGGEPLPNDLAQALYALGTVEKVGNLYGPTEDTTYSTYSLVRRGADRVLVGRPVANTRALVLDENLRPVPVGVIGELYLSGDGLSRGYAGRPDLTAERFIPNPFGPPGSRMYRVMDRIRWRPDGELEYFGRTDFQVKVRGFRIELGEIETTLRAHPAIRDAVAVVREDAPGDRRLVAYLVASEGMEIPATAELRAQVKEHLPEYMVPSAFVPLAALPLTPNGKVDRKALPAPDFAEPEDASYVAPRTEAEERLAAIFAEVLGIDRVGVHDDFFELGGHSLLATRVTTRVRQSLGQELPVRALFESPTVAGLAPRFESAPEPVAQTSSAGLARVPRDRPLPLSFAQRRLWFLGQLQGAPEVYNLSIGLRLRGELDTEALRGAIERIVARHEALRTRFVEVGGEPVQVIEPAMPFVLPVTDLSHFPEVGREARVRRHAEEEAARPFDLERAPMVRATLLRLGEREHVLLASMHHIASDGWSVGIFTAELKAHYEALLAGAEAELAPLAVQYADYAVWQRGREHDAEVRTQLDFWRRELAGAPAATDLPADRARPPVQRFRGASFETRVDPGLTASLRTLAKGEDATLFMVLLAGFGAWLRRYTGQDDVVVGSPVAGREHPALEPLIGCFINLLPLRLRMDAGESFRAALGRVRATTLDAFAHQDVSFDQVVEAAGIARETSRNPLVQVLFALQNTPGEPFALPGIEARQLEPSARTARYDLSLYLREDADGGLTALVEFDTDLYDRATVERWLGHYTRLLAAVAADPDAPAARAEMMDGAERERVLRDWNRTETETDRAATVPALFAAQARRTPQAVALVTDGETLTFAELDRRANRLAHGLIARGIGAESRVGLLLERSAEMVVAMLAVLKAGGAYVPLDPAYPAERVRFMAADAGLALVLADDELRARFPLDAPVLAPSDLSGEMGRDDDPEAAIAPGNAAYVIYTSGSTGRPKGVVVQHRNVANFFAAMDARVGAEPATWLAVTSISFDISVLEILWTLSRGSRVVMHGDRPRAASGDQAQAKAMGFSLFFFASSESAHANDKYRLLLEGAKFADANGFEAVWTPERHFHDFGGLYPNPAVTGAAIATITKNVRLRAGSVVLPLQDPLRIAEEWSVVDNLSGGRVEVSFASGWHANDFVLAPERYTDRREVMFSGIEEVRRLWRGDKLSRTNGKGETIQVGTLPRPVQPELPVWITAAGSPDTFRRAGMAGANLLTHLLGQSIAELGEKIRVYREGRREAGHDPAAGRVALMLHTYVDDDAARVRETVRGPFREYLRSSFDLVLQLAPAAGIDPKNLSPEDVETMLDFAFERYYGTSGLMGTPEACLETVRTLKAAGVDEVACLVDFGVEEERVLAGLDGLARVLRDSRAEPAPRDDGASVAERIRAHGVTHLQCTPSMAGMLDADPDAREALAGLRAILLGGEALPAALAKRLRETTAARVLNMYGPTETTVWSAVHEVDGAGGTVPIGRPIANTQIYIADADGQPVPAGVAGELLIGGEGVVRGYHGRPALTAERFVPDAFGRIPGGRLYRTGDLARRRDDGTLEFLGRIDQQVKVRGHRIEPGEIEAALAAHPAVRASVVVARDDGTGEKRLVAYVTPAAAEATVALPASPVLAAAEEERERILAGVARYTLPGGVAIAHQQDFITRELFHEIFEQGVYLRHGIELPEGARVVDVGSNIGMFTLFAHAAARGVRSWSFEPIPDTFAALRANAALLGPNARVFNTGVADAEGTARFTFYPNSTGLSGRYADVARDREITRSIIESGAEAAGVSTLAKEEVDALLDERFRAVEFDCPLRTLSAVIREEAIDRIDLLKVDVEKSELDVLMGIDDEHWPLIRQLAMEVDTEELLERISALLRGHGYDLVVDRHVTIRQDAGDGGEHVYMLYAKRPGDGAPLRAAARTELPTASELRRWLGERLPEYMVPSLFVTLDELPLTPNGKVDRRSLPDPTPTRAALEVEYAPPRNDLEGTISDVWREVLGVERVGIRDNFFELGGTSVRLATVHRLLAERLPRPVTVVDLFRHPTVAGLAEFLGSAEDGAARIRSDVQDRAGRQRQAQEARQRVRDRRR